MNVVIFILALRNALSSSLVTATSRLNTLEDTTTTSKAAADEILRKVKVGLRGSAVLLPLLGLTWVFGLLVFNRDTIVFKYLFAICNSLQGVMIFVFHVFFNRKVGFKVCLVQCNEICHITLQIVIIQDACIEYLI